MNHLTYQKARLSRDHRFDGLFFIAVKTTGIYCRPICPAQPPKEVNVTYYENALEASQAGFRPCLRCRPDSAPGSPVWNGTQTTLTKAIKLIQDGHHSHLSMPRFAEKLGVSDRYLRKLFDQHLGVSPKTFALWHQCQFAKKLLHETKLPITQIALSCGFNSIRRFNDAFKMQMGLAPSEIRRRDKPAAEELEIFLAFRPPYHWDQVSSFLKKRAIDGVEEVGEDFYQRNFVWKGEKGKFKAVYDPKRFGFKLSLKYAGAGLWSLIQNIKRVLDLDAEIQSIDKTIQSVLENACPGIRIPGAWSPFEAGLRAILGQQISVNASIKLLNQLVDRSDDEVWVLPEAERLSKLAIERLPIPLKRKDTLVAFCELARARDPFPVDELIKVKGIGPWTVQYIQFRGLGHPDTFLQGDLILRKQIQQRNLNPIHAAPWRSYLNIHLWSQT